MIPSELDLSSLSSDSSGQLDVLWHDGNSLGVDGTQVGIFEKTNQVSLRGLLESHDGRRLESKVSLEILSDFSNQSLEGEFPDQKFSGFLVSSDFSQGDGSGPVSMGLLDSSGGGGRFSGSLGCQLLSGSFSSSRLSGGLLGSGHC